MTTNELLNKLIAEIERLKQEKEISDDKEYAPYELDVACGYDMACEEIHSIISSLQQEQPEVELEKEIIRYQREDMGRDTTVGDVARHFYELGLNARLQDLIKKIKKEEQ